MPELSMHRSILRLALLVTAGGCALAGRASREPAVPAYLVGEWTDSTSEWRGDALARGNALYITPTGTFAFLGAPPYVQRRGVVTYDRVTQRIALMFTNPASTITLGSLRYDAGRRLLVADPAAENMVPMHRRRPNAEAPATELPQE